MNNVALNVLGEVYKYCKDIFGDKLCDAYLYGSYARGDYNKDSDIDILVTVDMEQPDKLELFNKVSFVSSRLSLKYDITVSVAVKELQQFIKYSKVLPYYSNVLKDGIKYAVWRSKGTSKS